MQTDGEILNYKPIYYLEIKKFFRLSVTTLTTLSGLRNNCSILTDYFKGRLTSVKI